MADRDELRAEGLTDDARADDSDAHADDFKPGDYRAPSPCPKSASGSNTLSMERPNSRAMRKARGKLGSYLPVSIALTV